LTPPRILLIDNYDSFTHNLAQGLVRAGAMVEVKRNDTIDSLDEFDGIVISPGPGRPDRQQAQDRPARDRTRR